MKSLNRPTIILIWTVSILVGILFLTNPVLSKTVPKGKVIIAIGTNISTLDPHMHAERVNHFVNWAICDNLVYRDPKSMKVTPHLAESWKLINDTTWEFKLRKGVAFHNDDPFNAECVKFSIERVLNPEQKSPQRGNILTIDHVEIVDDHTVRLITKKPDPILLERLQNFQMIDPKYVKKVGDAHYSKNPMGTGPYKFVNWVKGQRLVLEANENYWKFSPAIKTVVFRPIPETATQMAELISGGVHLIRTVPPDQMEVIEKSGIAYISKAPILRSVWLYFDSDGRGSKSPVQNLKVRQAISHAINVDAIIKHILHGLAIKTPAVLSPFAFGYDPTIKNYSYDPEKAKKLLAEAGYPDGFTINIDSYTGSVVSVNQVVEAISGDLAKIGLKVKNTHYEDGGSWIKTRRAGKMKDSQLFSWGSYNIFDADMLYYPLSKKGEGFTYASDEELDKFLIDGRSTMDMEKRKKIYSNLQKHLIKNAYWVPMYSQYAILGVSNKIQYEAASDEMIRVFDIKWRD